MRLPGNARTLVVALAAVLAVVVGSGVAWLVGREGASGTLSKAPETTTTTAAPVVEVEESTIATTTGGPIDVYTEPVAGAPVQTTLSAETEYLVPRTLLVIDQQPAPAEGDAVAPEWLQVLLPIRPNGSTGWIRPDGVTLSTTTYEIRIELAAHKLTLLDGDQVMLEAPTVIGTASTPTPPGQYYITDPVDLQDRPNGGYGAYALGISGYSEVLLEFNGGPGQLAVHGTVQTSLLGQDASNGCIRVDNPTILQIANTVPIGTPVTILA